MLPRVAPFLVKGFISRCSAFFQKLTVLSEDAGALTFTAFKDALNDISKVCLLEFGDPKPRHATTYWSLVTTHISKFGRTLQCLDVPIINLPRFSTVSPTMKRSSSWEKFQA